MRKAILALILILILVGLGTVLPVGTRTHQGCIDCGLRRKDLTLLGVAMPTETRTPRSDWYDRRIGAPHQHRWTKLSCTRSFNLWGGTTLWACGPWDVYPGDDTALAAILNRLEPLDLDLPFHDELTHADAERRRAASTAARKFDPAWKNPEVWRWWEDGGWPWPRRR